MSLFNSKKCGVVEAKKAAVQHNKEQESIWEKTKKRIAKSLEKTEAKPNWEKGIDSNGKELIDPRPNQLLLDCPKPKPLDEVFAEIFRKAEARAAEQGYETYEESEDFNIGDDYDPNSPYELDPDHEYQQQGSFSPEIPTEPAKKKANNDEPEAKEKKDAEQDSKEDSKKTD
jgi:hypothetical protein